MKSVKYIGSVSSIGVSVVETDSGEYKVALSDNQKHYDFVTIEIAECYALAALLEQVEKVRWV